MQDKNRGPCHSTLKLELVSMSQRSEVRHKGEDWTGISSSALRRKLQNRLNKRASRSREALGKQQSTEIICKRDARQNSDHLNSGLMYLSGVIQHPKYIPDICMLPEKRRLVTSASDFASFLPTPLPNDQKLFTLLHFNLVRAITQNIELLGLKKEQMNDDIESPFLCKEVGRDIGILPPILQPTALQLSVPHHPEIDVIPFPTCRDNMILAAGTIDDVELCLDLLYGVERGSNGADFRNCYRSGRTGLIVWGDPWLQESWEVDQAFAKKYRKLFEGCRALIDSTNFWRKSRGERPLVLAHIL